LSWYDFGTLFLFFAPLFCVAILWIANIVAEAPPAKEALAGAAILNVALFFGIAFFGSEVIARAEGAIRYELRENNDGTKTWHRVAVEQKK
jgi:hypothetical protein